VTSDFYIMVKKFKLLINGPSRTITSAAAVIALTGFVSRLLGVVRDRVLAGEFGAGNILDAYYAAFRIPDLVFNLLVMGALSAGFIPVFAGYLNKSNDKQEAWDLASGLLNILIILLIIICGALVLLAPFLVPLIAPGFNQEKIKMTVELTRIMFLSPIFLGLSSLFGGILQTFKRFLVFSLAPIFYNIGIIIGAVVFVRWWGIIGLAVGVVFGALMHMLIQIPTAVNLGFRYKTYLSLTHPGIRKIGRLMVPRTLGLAITQINLVIITIIASILPEGSLAIFNLANNLQSFPVGIFGISYALAAFPTLSEYFVQNKSEEFVQTFSKTVRQILFLIIPTSVLFITLRAQIVRVILGSGQFDWNATILTAAALGFFSLSMFAQALIPLLARSFYARHNTKTPFWAAFIGMIVNTGLALLLAKPLGIIGLALAFTIASIVNLLALYIWLRHKIGRLNEKVIIKSTSKVLVASLIMAGLVQLTKYLIALTLDIDTFIGIFSQGLVAGLVGIVVFIAVSYLLKSDEIKFFETVFKRRVLGIFRTEYKIKEGIDPEEF